MAAMRGGSEESGREEERPGKKDERGGQQQIFSRTHWAFQVGVAPAVVSLVLQDRTGLLGGRTKAGLSLESSGAGRVFQWGFSPRSDW